MDELKSHRKETKTCVEDMTDQYKEMENRLQTDLKKLTERVDG